MSEMRRALMIAGLATIVVVAGSATGSAQPGPAGPGDREPLTTGRALIDVRTPPLPLQGERDRRRQVLSTSRDLLDTVAGRDGIEVDARSVAGGFIATDLGTRSI